MNSVKVSDLPKFDNPHGLEVKQVYNSPQAQVMHLNLKPGQGMKAHASPLNIVFYVLEGRGKVETDGESIEVGQDTVIESPANSLHRLEAASDSALRVLVIKTPMPA
jgi:quercetin dioxygenase-like cupin family protein